MTSIGEHDRRWTFVTNHALVLAYIAKDPHARLRDIALGVGITERTTAQIVNDLERTGYLTKTRNGRRNQYTVEGHKQLRHPRLKGLTASQVIALVLEALNRQPFS
jgi:DNA-binding MarR family transcriptional regulator